MESTDGGNIELRIVDPRLTDADMDGEDPVWKPGPDPTTLRAFEPIFLSRSRLAESLTRAGKSSFTSTRETLS